MTGWQGAILAATLLVLCVATSRFAFGYKAWPLCNKINYVVMILAAWPWIIYGYFADPPRWYTTTAAIAFAGSISWFLFEQFRFLSRTRTELQRLTAAAAATADCIDRHGHDHDWPCPDALLRLAHPGHEWTAESGLRRDCAGYPPAKTPAPS